LNAEQRNEEQRKLVAMEREKLGEVFTGGLRPGGVEPDLLFVTERSGGGGGK
jgi:hypothetical protein